jgi:16S rRNA (guanine966-N2)-methyltransferase
MQPRIITGSAKGQKLEVPKKGTRPMTDRVKSALFSMIQSLIQDARVLDLYAGTGALGIECLSRGAKSAIFVDRSKYAVACIKQNLEKVGFTALARVIKCSASRLLDEYETFDLEPQAFDIIFITPPHDDYKESIIERATNLLEKDGIIIAEHPSSRKTGDRVGDLEKIDERDYGRTSLSLYRLDNAK